MGDVDVQANRQATKWTRREQVRRVLWSITYPLFRLSPRPLWAWRRALLKMFGARVGAEAHIYSTVRITMPWNIRFGDRCAIGDRVILYALAPIVVGANSTVSQGSHLCAGSHDWRKPDMPLLKLPIEIGSECWICADTFVGPGVTIGDGAILGARAVAMKDIPASAIAVGNPAKVVSTRNEQ